MYDEYLTDERVKARRQERYQAVAQSEVIW